MSVPDERGFSLLEVVVCVGVLTLACVFALALLPSLYRSSESGLLRAAATSIARNQIERLRAAAAYYPAASVLDPAARATTTLDHAWAFNALDTYVATARLHRAFCGGAGATTDVAMTVTTAYTPAAPPALDSLSVRVSYPRSPCDPGTQDAITLVARLAPAQYAPQTVVQSAIADPAYQ